MKKLILMMLSAMLSAQVHALPVTLEYSLNVKGFYSSEGESPEALTLNNETILAVGDTITGRITYDDAFFANGGSLPIIPVVTHTLTFNDASAPIDTISSDLYFFPGFTPASSRLDLGIWPRSSYTWFQIELFFTGPPGLPGVLPSADEWSDYTGQAISRFHVDGGEYYAFMQPFGLDVVSVVPETSQSSMFLVGLVIVASLFANLSRRHNALRETT